MKKTASYFLFLFLIVFSLNALADVRLPAIIGDHMVLQQNTKVKIWGWCEPNETVKLKTDWDTTTYQTKGSSSATWSIELTTPTAGGVHKISIDGYNHIDINDVLTGEVWVCSGQSNMEMNYNWGLPAYEKDVEAANNQNIRFFYIPKTTSVFPQEDVKAKWVVCTPEEMKRFSAVGYFFGNSLHQTLNVPVGLINANWGGTPAEVWTPEQLVESDNTLKQAAAQLKPSNGWPVVPGATWNAMIYPVTNYPIAGAIWYQGESNVGTASTYQALFTSMIGAWRKAWNKDFPFYFVQIAPFSGYTNNQSAFLREAQTKSWSYPNTGMVVTSDLVDNIKDIHPKMKKEVGLRLANYALAETYGKKVLSYKSPVYRDMKVEKSRIRINFDHAEGGLVSKGGAPTEFYIAGEDGKFVPATAKIEGNSVVVWNKEIKTPVAVRFGFSDASMPNLFSKDGLPVVSFRTDTWNDR